MASLFQVQAHGLIILKYLALLLGNDYSSGFRGVGPAKAVAILSDSALEAELQRSPIPSPSRSIWTLLLAAAASNRVKDTDVIDQRALQDAFDAFHYPVVFIPATKTFAHANAQDAKSIPINPAMCGQLPSPSGMDDALQFTFMHSLRGADLPQLPVTRVQRSGEAVPTSLQCWMLPGSRPALLPAQASLVQLQAELKANSLNCDGELGELRSRATAHSITIRKPAMELTGDECRSVLRSREVSPATTVADLRQQVQRLYAVEDTPNYGPPRLKDPLGISLLSHLCTAGHVRRPTTANVPTTGWVAAGEGLPLEMSVARAWFVDYNERLVGDFKSRQFKEGYARIKNRTSLLNFGYHGVLPRVEPEAKDPEPEEASEKEPEPAPKPSPSSVRRSKRVLKRTLRVDKRSKADPAPSPSQEGAPHSPSSARCTKRSMEAVSRTDKRSKVRHAAPAPPAPTPTATPAAAAPAPALTPTATPAAASPAPAPTPTATPAAAAPAPALTPSATPAAAAPAPAQTQTCFYKMDCPASMKMAVYEVTAEIKAEKNAKGEWQLVQVVAASCSSDCPAGAPSLLCVHPLIFSQSATVVVS